MSGTQTTETRELITGKRAANQPGCFSGAPLSKSLKVSST
jgi:hypothetical protein